MRYAALARGTVHFYRIREPHVRRGVPRRPSWSGHGSRARARGRQPSDRTVTALLGAGRTRRRRKRALYMHTVQNGGAAISAAFLTPRMAPETECCIEVIKYFSLPETICLGRRGASPPTLTAGGGTHRAAAGDAGKFKLPILWPSTRRRIYARTHCEQSEDKRIYFFLPLAAAFGASSASTLGFGGGGAIFAAPSNM